MLTVRNDRSIRALAVGFLLLVIAIIGTIILSLNQREATKSVEHTLRVEGHLSSILSHAQDAETGQRGFLLTADTLFLTTYNAGADALPQELKVLRVLVSDNSVQLNRVAELEQVMRHRLDLLETGIEMRKAGKMPTDAMLRSGYETMKRVRFIIGMMQREERSLLAKRNASADLQWALVLTGLAISTLIVLGLGIAAQRHARGLVLDLMHSRDAQMATNAQLVEEVKQRELAESQLRLMQKTEAVGQLTGGIAHDFNNMLAIVIGSIDIALRRGGAELNARVRQALENAMEGAQRASQLTARLLAFSRQQPLAPKPLNLNRLVGSMSDLLHRTIGDSVRVETVLAAGLWNSFVDANQLENAIINLCVNARDAMPDGGRLTIETANTSFDDAYVARFGDVKAGQYVMISVTDSGTGMSAEVIERAFDPFFTTKSVGKGTGLGLSQVHGFVKQSGGHVNIYSEIGHGSSFKVYLPRHMGEEELSVGEWRADDRMTLGAKPGETVLVVEDEDRVRQMSCDALRDLGYRVLQAASAAEALAVLDKEPRIDLLFTDIVMPDVNGRKLADQVEKLRPEIRTVFTTGYTRNAIVHNGMLDPGVNFLPKPFTLEQLARKLRAVLDTGSAD